MNSVIDLVPAAFVLLLVVIDPFGLTPMFSALTAGKTPGERRRTAVEAVLIAAGVLALFVFAGSRLFDYLGIGLPAFRIAGGTLLFLIAIDMLLVRHSGLTSTTLRERSEAARREDVAVFPLAIPLIAGPGALTTVMLLTRDQELGRMMLVLALALAVLAITLAMFLAAARVERLLGETGINVITRLLGILLAALAVQFVLDGLREGLPGLVGGFAAHSASR
ncbi:MAG: MarC family protein [Pseudomonadota bacterium]